MDAHFPIRHQSAKVVVGLKTTNHERGIRNEDYDNWYRFGKEYFSDSRRRCSMARPIVRKQLKRAEMSPYFANLPPCLIGMEACGSAHHWARKLGGFGHTVKLMAPQFVKPYVKTNKNDMADAEAICEAVADPTCASCRIKNVEQQAMLSVHRARQGFVKARTAQANQIRGLLSEFGIVIPQGIHSIAKQMPDILEDGENNLPGTLRQLMERLTDNLKEMDRQVEDLELQIKLWHANSEASRKLEAITRHRSDHSERHCGDGGQCHGVQER